MEALLVLRGTAELAEELEPNFPMGAGEVCVRPRASSIGPFKNLTPRGRPPALCRTWGEWSVWRPVRRAVYVDVRTCVRVYCAP
jgi:hypothetical protein